MTLPLSSLPLTERHPFTRYALAVNTFRQGKFEATVKRLDKLAPSLERRSLLSQALVEEAGIQLAYALHGLGRHAHAETHLRCVVEARIADWSRDCAATLEACARLAEVIGAQRRITQAETLLDEAVEHAEQLPQFRRSETIADLQMVISWLQLRDGRPAEAAVLVGPAHAQLTSGYGSDDYEVLSAQTLWVDCLARTGKLNFAAQKAKDALTIRPRELGADHPYTRTTQPRWPASRTPAAQARAPLGGLGSRRRIPAATPRTRGLTIRLRTEITCTGQPRPALAVPGQRSSPHGMVHGQPPRRRSGRARKRLLSKPTGTVYGEART